MYLLYLAAGERRYGKLHPRPYARKRWAFQFILKGKVSMMIRQEGAASPVEERLKGDLLTVAGPQCVHDWGGSLEDRCEVLVFHFDEADTALAPLIGNDGYRLLSVTEEEVTLARNLHARCAAAQKSATPLAAPVYRIAAAELTLMTLGKIDTSSLRPPQEAASRKVAAALAWLEVHLHHQPTLEEVARAVHLSPAHLRRLFHQITGASPHASFRRLRFEAAIALMADPTLTLEQIALDTGFGSASAFSRAFRSHFGTSPGSYRALSKG